MELVQSTGMQWQSTSGTCWVHVWVGSSQWAVVWFNNMNLYMDILGLFFDRSQEGAVQHTCALACYLSPPTVSWSWEWVRQAKGFALLYFSSCSLVFLIQNQITSRVWHWLSAGVTWLSGSSSAINILTQEIDTKCSTCVLCMRIAWNSKH